VPAQPPGGGVDVTVEPFFEWVIERPPFGEDPPSIPGAHFVDDLSPYIERKQLLAEQDAQTATATITGLEPEHPLFAKVQAVVEARQADIGSRA